MAARRFLAPSALVLAAGASLATSTAETGDPLVPIAPYDHAVVIAPGTSIQADFRVGVALGSVGQIQTSWAQVGALVPAQSSDGQVEVALDGPFDGDSLGMSADPTEPYEDSGLVDGVASGCVESGGTCWATWTVTLTHTGGSQPVELHWQFDPFASGASGAIPLNVVAF